MRSYLFLRILFVILSVFALTIPSISDDNRGREYLFTISDSLHNNIKNLQTKSKNTILKRSLTISDDSDVRQVFSDRAESLSQWYLLRVSDTQDPRVEALQKNSNVIQMQENHTFRVHIDQPNDPLLSEQWYHERLNTAESWGNFTLNPDIILAVIDTGIDYVHPDLTGSIWINHAEDLNKKLYAGNGQRL